MWGEVSVWWCGAGMYVCQSQQHWCTSLSSEIFYILHKRWTFRVWINNLVKVMVFILKADQIRCIYRSILSITTNNTPHGTRYLHYAGLIRPVFSRNKTENRKMWSLLITGSWPLLYHWTITTPSHFPSPLLSLLHIFSPGRDCWGVWPLTTL